MTNSQKTSAGKLAAVTRSNAKSVARMRTELLDPFSSILGLCQVMQTDFTTNDAPQALQADVSKLYEYSRSALCVVRRIFKEEPDSDCFDSSKRSETFHDILNYIGFIKGQSDWMLLSQDDEYFPNLVGDLTEINGKCDGLTATIRKYKLKEYVGDASEADTQLVHEPVRDAGRNSPSQKFADSPKILIVDDKPENCDFASRLLQEMGCECVSACSGVEGLEILRQDDSIDIVLLDYMMPEMNGYEMLLKIKHDEQLKSVSVIIVSALDQTTHIADCIEAGADDFLPKPINSRLLQARLNSCLMRRKLTELEYSQFFPPSVARSYVRNPNLRNVAKQAEVSVLFCDIRGFSGICEKVGTTLVVEWLGDVVTWLAECVLRNGGVIVDFIGDEVMAMWGAPEKCDDHAEKACLAALEMLETLPEISAVWEKKLGYATELGIGINTGIASVGNTGSRHRFKYGPLGSAVNVASRVQGATKHLRVPLLITRSTKVQLPFNVSSRKVCSVQVVNVVEPVELYDVFPDEQLSQEDLKQYELALDAFESGHLDRSTVLLGELLTRIPDDGPSLILMSRIAATKLGHQKLHAVWELPSK